MTYSIRFDLKARQDLIEIFKFIAFNESIEIADHLVDRIENCCSKLSKFPERGHIPSELQLIGIKRYLEIYCRPYRIIYEIKNKSVYIHAVIDERRNIQELLAERLLRS